MSANTGGIRTSEGETEGNTRASGDCDTLVSIPTQRWRVKLYELEGGDWNDRGTGHCWGTVTDGTAVLNVQDETDNDSMLIESKILSDTRYQRHNALIIWKVDDIELALSFQEVLGCISLCDFLIWVHQALDPTVQLLSCSSAANGGAEFSELITSRLPPLPTRTNLDHVIELVTLASETQYGHESLLLHFGHVDYLQHIMSLFKSVKAAEDLSTSERLKLFYRLSSLVKLLLLFGESSLLEMFLEDEYFLTVLDILEYDEEFGRKKANYRSFFEKQARFRQVVPISDEKIVEKIKKTFRLQLLKDVVLARLMDDASFQMISSLIFMNHIEIIVWMQSTPEFSNALFGLYDPKLTPLIETEARDEGLQFTAHLTMTSRPFQPTQRVTLYLIMVENGLFSVLNYGLAHSDRQMRNLALDIVGTILEADPNVIWVDAAHRYNSRVINGLINIFNNDEDTRLQRQACEALKALLESAAEVPSDPENVFYEKSAPILFGGVLKRQRAEQDTGGKASHYFELALDLLGFCLRRRPTATMTLMERLDLFPFIATTIATPPSKAALLAALRCIRSFLVACELEQAESLLAPNGCLNQVLALMVRLGNVNNAVHSGGLELLLMVTPTSEEKYLRIRQWLVLQPELSQLDYIPCTRAILAAAQSSASSGLSSADASNELSSKGFDDDGSETSEDDDASRKRPAEEEQHVTLKRIRDARTLSTDEPSVSPRRSVSLPNTSSPPETPPRLSLETPSPRRAMRIMSTPPATRQASTHETMLKLGPDQVAGPGTPRPRERQNLRKRLVAAKKFVLHRST